jgi:hypothetical protein
LPRSQSLPFDLRGCRIATQYRLPAITLTGDTRHEFRPAATGLRTVQDASRRPGRDRALAYSPSRSLEAVLRRARRTFRREILPDAVARCRKACAVPVSIRSIPRPAVSRPTAPAPNAGAGSTRTAVTTAGNPSAPKRARARLMDCSVQSGTATLLCLWALETARALARCEQIRHSRPERQ